jgi:hypothetical protein
MDDIRPKAAKEGSNVIVRAIQNAVKLIPIRNEAVAALALISGVGGLGAASMFMPFITKVGFSSAVGYGLYRGLKSPKLRQGIGKVIQLTEQAAKKTTDPAVLRQLRADRAALIELMKDFPEEDKQ